MLLFSGSHSLHLPTSPGGPVHSQWRQAESQQGTGRVRREKRGWVHLVNAFKDNPSKFSVSSESGSCTDSSE